MPSTPADLVAQQDEYRNHIWAMCLWPAQWESSKQKTRLKWQSVTLQDASKSHVPTTSGIYSLLVQPGIANHDECSYLMYVGKTTSLRTRFGDYLTTEKIRRSKIVRLLHMYDGYIHFCFCKVREAKLDDIEEQLYSAFVPPCNSQFSGELSRAKGAFK